MPKRFAIEERTNWRRWVTPGPLEDKPIHRWFVFPHSFTSELVQGLIDEWEIGEKDQILDPFVGAGTTLVAAKERGVSATGYDISPLAVLGSRAKVTKYNRRSLDKAWRHLWSKLKPNRWIRVTREYPDLVREALPGKLLSAFDQIRNDIVALPCAGREKNFFRLALLSILPEYSRAVATGGWLSWVENGPRTTSIPSRFERQVTQMLEDLEKWRSSQRTSYRVRRGDARRLSEPSGKYSAVITSPPYPNRHDYTRVFGVQLMFGFLSWEKTKQLRYQSFHSHPEAHPERPNINGYIEPERVSKTIKRLTREGFDQRIVKMIQGYFQDMYLSLKEVRRVCKKGAHIAYVVGNAQYGGIPIPVDELTAEIGEQAGLSCEKLVVARYRGNSAQQMGEYGRRPSRESVVIFRK